MIMRIQMNNLAKFRLLQGMKRPIYFWLSQLEVVGSGSRSDTLTNLCPSQSTNQRFLSTKRPSSVHHAILRVHGPDSKGVVAAVSNVLDKFGCAITQSEQWTDTMESMFFERLQFSNYDTPFSDTQMEDISLAMKQVCQGFSLQHDINWRQTRRRVAIFVSKYDHCLWEILLRHEARELDCDIVAIVSNHENLRSVANTFGIPYHFTHISPDYKKIQEQKQLDLLQNLKVDLVVLARYMQVLSPSFLQQFSFDRIINIHHSFLPAFAGK
jgi:formyltetrahydrofolate deformylase